MRLSTKAKARTSRLMRETLGIGHFILQTGADQCLKLEGNMSSSPLKAIKKRVSITESRQIRMEQRLSCLTSKK